MSKGLKVFQAKHAINGKDIYLTSISEEEKKHLICDGCRTKLKYTRGHWRMNTWVSSFFSLSPNCTHEDGCRYNTAKAIELIVRQSTSIENGEIQTLFENRINFEFRLNILSEQLEEEKKNNKARPENSTLVRKKSSKELSAYVKTAKGIAKLWHSIQDSSDKELLKDKIQIVLGRNRIFWEDFVFDYNDLDRLLKTKPKYPVALILQTKKFNKSNDERSLKNCIQCYSSPIEDNYIIPKIFYNGDFFKENRQFLVVAYAKFLPQKEDSKYINLNIFIQNKSQLVMLNDENIPK